MEIQASVEHGRSTMICLHTFQNPQVLNWLLNKTKCYTNTVASEHFIWQQLLGKNAVYMFS